MIKRVWCTIALTLIGGLAAWAQPVISAGGVQDAGGYTADIAQGSVFVVKGTNLSPAGFVQAPAPNYPTTLNNVQITFTPAAGGTAVQARMVYTYNQGGVNQLAAVLPSTTAAGDYDVRVVYNGNSPALRSKVVARKPGIVTANGSGSGPAQATLAGAAILQRFAAVGRVGDFDTRPARPGERVDLWGTGLGPDTASDTGGTSGDQTSAGQIRVVVNGADITPLYAGRSSGFPGLDQIVFTLPGNIAPSCAVNIQVRSGGVLSNAVSVAVANGNACPHPTLNEETLRRLSQGGTANIGAFTVASSSVTIPGISFGGISLPPTVSYAETIGGAFTSFAADFANDSTLGSVIGSCSVWKRTATFTQLALGVPPKPLDAGATLTAGTPSNPNVVLAKLSPTDFTYNANIGTTTGQTRTIQPGTYTLRGTGGADIGAFNASVIVPAFTWTNAGTTTVVNRAQGLPVNWTGGSPGVVSITGFAGRTISGNTIETAVIEATGFVCVANGSALSFTVPASVLQQLPAVTFDVMAIAGGGPFAIGSLSVLASSDGQNGKFTAPLTRGGNIDYGLYSYAVGDTKLLSYQ